jgi:hypothetical protein
MSPRVSSRVLTVVKLNSYLDGIVAHLKGSVLVVKDSRLFVVPILWNSKTLNTRVHCFDLDINIELNA